MLFLYEAERRELQQFIDFQKCSALVVLPGCWALFTGHTQHLRLWSLAERGLTLTTGPSHSTRPSTPFIPIHAFEEAAGCGASRLIHTFLKTFIWVQKKIGSMFFFHVSCQTAVCCTLVKVKGSHQQVKLISQFSSLILTTAAPQLFWLSSNWELSLGGHVASIRSRLWFKKQKRINASTFSLSTIWLFKPSKHHSEVMSWLLFTFSLGLSLIIVREEHTAQLINWINIWPLFHKLALGVYFNDAFCPSQTSCAERCTVNWLSAGNRSSSRHEVN